ncbi:SUMF1/EgtB/PvdO family nonheme iron enzyme [Patulibacter americanus]|uniref:SUMF1/EgtB/PvdO family nonheme iron enzyme n=1 Tax=Patulibacter americanus TaxID=588672 RepID=UPI0003B760F6|nr:SUMF1/EgtB/PvdO family nonheme iron enzyme [Patulibacter americanus]
MSTAQAPTAHDPTGVLRAPLPEDPHEALHAVRERTRTLVAGLTRAQLETQFDPLLSPLVWDLAHIAAYEDLWLVHRHGGRPLLHPELAAMYDAFETPRAVRGDLELLDVPAAWAYLDDVRGRVDEVVAERGVDPELHELVLRHELQHTETMLQAMRLGGLAPWLDALPGGAGDARPAGADARPREQSDDVAARALARVRRPALIDVPAPDGRVSVGADPEGFAYDNERPRHERPLEPFRIARRPVTVETWRAFAADGGYDDRALWSDDGWAWRAGGAGTDVRDSTGGGGYAGPPPGARGEDEAACHLSFFEAEAIAAWCGLRLPTEAEWEHARASGLLHDAGAVWEWTASPFEGYPGFVPRPYPEYSAVFFGRGYRVLRGGSFASHPRVATASFRNWDLPERHQIFSGVRLAADAPDHPSGAPASRRPTAGGRA